MDTAPKPSNYECYTPVGFASLYVRNEVNWFGFVMGKPCPFSVLGTQLRLHYMNGIIQSFITLCITARELQWILL
jgi:hypothetical protein